MVNLNTLHSAWATDTRYGKTTEKFKYERADSRCASFCNFNVVLLISFAIPPAIRPNSLFVPPAPPFGVLLPLPFSFGIKGCLASDFDLFLPDVEEDEAGRAERDLIDARVE